MRKDIEADKEGWQPKIVPPLQYNQDNKGEEEFELRLKDNSYMKRFEQKLNTPTETDIEAVAYSPNVNAVRAIVVKHFNEYPNALLMELADLLTHQHTGHAREMLEIVENAANHIINKSKSIENPPEAHSAITHNRGFIYGVEALRDDIKVIAIKKNIKLN